MKNERGFATVMAVSMIALISVMLVLLMAELRDVRQEGRELRSEAELRQMLLAGGAAAGKLVAEPKESLDVKLPPELSERGGSLKLRMLESSELEKRIAVEATLLGHTAKQTLRYVKTDYGWGLIEAKLE